ncbi:MAG: ABC transporter permease [Chitinophagales bacterium]|nr:ABC transporter permease [Chitinophagales bacterium]
MNAGLKQYIILALRSIRYNLLRSILTLSIISFGIMALVGILTAIDSIENSVKSSFSEYGASSFTIQNSEQLIVRGGGFHGPPQSKNPPISIDQATDFKDRFPYEAFISAYYEVSTWATVKHRSNKTNPNVTVIGIDENYLSAFNENIESGRNLTKEEIISGSNYALVGKSLVKNIFNVEDSVVNSLISIGNVRYRVAGILESKGQSQNTTDNKVLISYVNARRNFGGSDGNFKLNISVDNPENINFAVSEATGLMRSIRKLKLSEGNDFAIIQSEKVVEEMFSQIRFIGIAAFFIGIITLLGAGIGLMNIMLVSVNERTREIGVSKALGATKKAIMTQYLTEATVICQIGGILGVILGLLAGNAVSILLKSDFVIPWAWMFMGLAFCFIVGLAAGIYPAIRAGSLHPVEALRHE